VLIGAFSLHPGISPHPDPLLFHLTLTPSSKRGNRNHELRVNKNLFSKFKSKNILLIPLNHLSLTLSSQGEGTVTYELIG